MTKKLSEVVLETQQAETAFETNALWKLNDMAEHPNAATFESDATMLRLYAGVIRGMADNTNELIEMSRSQG